MRYHDASVGNESYTMNLMAALYTYNTSFAVDGYTLTLFTIVIVFWLLAIVKAKSLGRPWFPNLVIVAVFFLTIGMVINHMRPPWGTYLVGGLHALLLAMLAIKLVGGKR